jgi:Protein of unknown function (DUF1236)
MKSDLRSVMMAIVLLGAAGLAVAQTGDTLALTARQRAEIYQTVAKEKDKVRTPPPVNLRVSIGAQLPASIELYMLPDDVGAAVPATKIYRYTVVQNQVVIVDPTTMKVVDLITQ